MVKHPLFARFRTAFRRRFARAQGIEAHFRHVIDLAAADEGREGPAVGDAEQELLISFVVPVFNTDPKYLTELLASFRIQPSNLCDLILSDDGSTSLRTQQWLDEHSATMGVSILRNKKIAESRLRPTAGLPMRQGIGSLSSITMMLWRLMPSPKSPRLWSGRPCANFFIPMK